MMLCTHNAYAGRLSLASTSYESKAVDEKLHVPVGNVGIEDRSYDNIIMLAHRRSLF
jgi:hypothetical protein